MIDQHVLPDYKLVACGTYEKLSHQISRFMQAHSLFMFVVVKLLQIGGVLRYEGNHKWPSFAFGR